MAHLKTDVLVVGAGIAGWFAADKARKQGASVVLVDKGYIGKAGQSVIASHFSAIPPDSGESAEEWLDFISRSGEYLVNREWAGIVLRNSYDRLCDLVDWGVRFATEEDGSIKFTGGILKAADFIGSGRSPVPFRDTVGCRARTHLKDIGVTLLDRVMIVEPMRQNGRVVGAVGLGADSGEEYVIEAKATVFCTGGCGLKPAGYPCLVSSTGDGEGMAYRMGASLVGKEFVQPMHTSIEMPGILGSRGVPADRAVSPKNLRGAIFPRDWTLHSGESFPKYGEKVSPYPFAYLDPSFEAHAGHAPLHSEISGIPVEISSGAALGMSVRKADGIWPADTSCRTEVPGLYAAGDTLGTMQNGALYTHSGGSLTGCAVTGAIAGESAAAEALALEGFYVDDGEISRAREVVFAPLSCPGGYSPRWVTRLLKDLVTPYYVSLIKKADRLQAALTMVEFIQEHMIPRLIARDAHELRLAHETKNMALSIEVRLRCALYRTESRGMHYREDFPKRDDKQWLAWTKVQNSKGGMALKKVPVPEAWRPDPALTYEERYPYRFPGE